MDESQRATTGTAEAGPAQDPPPPPARPPLRRRTDDAVIAGVASGLAAYLNVDPALVRIGFVVLLFAGGVGLPAYIAGWLLIPEADEHETEAQELIRSKGPGFWVGIGILVLIALAVTESLAFSRGWWPLVLIGAGVALWRAGQRPAETAGAPPAVVQAPGSRPQPAVGTTTTSPSPAPARQGPAWTPPPPREPNPLGRVTLALALIAAGVTVLIDRAGLVEAHLGHVAASALLVLGLGLVVGAWFGRARALVFPGLVLVPIVVLAGLSQAASVPWDAGFGERVVHIGSAADVAPDGYRLAAGQLSLRLDGISRDAGRVEITAEVGAGQIDVRVPTDAEVRVRARTGAGDLQIFDRGVSGVGDLDETVVQEGEPGAPVIILDLRTGVGQIVVQARGVTTAPTS